jgi:drug/metabolite transporter (DMT)-like permease
MSIILVGVLLVVFTTLGQLLLKIGSYKYDAGVLNVYVISGYIFFICVVVASFFLMKMIEFKLFSVIMSINFLSVMLASRIFLNEKTGKNTVYGTIFIFAGLIVFFL